VFEKINVRSSVAAYIQIENQVQFAVASGQLAGEDRLPSLHELSQKMNLNINTVAKAYRDLEITGILNSRRGMGAFINKGVEPKCREICRRRILERLKEVVSEARAAGMPAQEIKEICASSYASSASPYEEPPSALLAMAKKTGTAKK
jgi:GntR family transcriptional regulator